MSIRLETITLRNPSSSLNRATASMALCHAPPASLGFEALCRGKPRGKVSIPALPAVIGVNLWHRSVRKRSVLSFAVPHEESKASDIDIENKKEDLKAGAQDSKEAWQQTLLKLQSKLEEAELSIEKVIKMLEERVKIEAGKLREEWAGIAKEVAEESKEFLAKPPEPVKDIVETFTYSTDELMDVSEMRDFYVGIPYGALLCIGGFISFMFTGSIPAIRFGVILGGTLLALSISSLRSWKKGEFSPAYLNGQSVIAFILFLRELRLFFMRPFISSFISLLISCGIVVFYLYRQWVEKESSGSNLEAGPEN